MTEYERLGSTIQLENMPFNEVQALIRGFLFHTLAELPKELQLRIEPELIADIRRYLDVARQGPGEMSPSAELTEARIALWRLHDAQLENSDAKKFARVAVCGLYDEESSEHATFGSGAMFEAFFSVLMDLNPNCCRCFAGYVVREVTLTKIAPA